MFLQETRLKPAWEKKYIREWHNENCIFNSTNGGKGGTAIFVNIPAIKIHFGSKLVDPEGRVIAIDIEMYGVHFHLINSYGPNEHKLRIPFLNRLYVYLNSGKPIIWGGDHNIATNPRLDRYPTRIDGDYGRSDILDIINVFDLKDTCRTIYPDSIYYTFRRGTYRSRIDKICVSSGFTVQSYSQEETGLSDHELIKSCILFNSTCERGPGIWKNNVKYYKDDSFEEDFRTFWIECVNSDIAHDRNLVNWWLKFNYKFKLFYIKYCRQKLLFQRRHEHILENGLDNALQALNQNPDSNSLVNNYIKIKKELVDYKIKITKEKMFKSDAQYLMCGEKLVKGFFDKFKNKKERKPILSLKDDHGNECFEIGGIMKIAEGYFRQIFSPREVRQPIINLFLDNIRPVASSEYLMRGLMDPFTLEEIWDAICSFLMNKSPGPDGISIEFYKATFEIIKHDLRKMLNTLLMRCKIPSKFKAGLITLIPKQEPFNDIENFRPISLLNTDYKIFTKILTTRLNPILKDIIHVSQFAQPGRDIQEMNSVIRDLVEDMERSCTDSFFVSVDFRKAYDSVNQDFLLQVMRQYGFPRYFVLLIKELFRDAGSHLFINGFKSSKIKLRSGIRQGCPMSRSTFTLQLNPLIVFLNDAGLSPVTKYSTLSNKDFLTLAFMDDANFFTQSFCSVLNSISYIRRFKYASGLEMNMSKSVGKFYNKQNFHRVEHLPNIKWVENIRIVKINHSPKSWVISQWGDVLSMFRNEIKFFKTTAHTFQAKAIVSKSKLLSKLTYMCSVHVMPAAFKKSINKALLGFLVPFSSRNLLDNEISSQITRFAAPKHLGGYGVDHISIHADLLLLKPVMKYIKCLSENVDLPNELFFVEYHIGVQLSRLFGFKVNNCTAHTDQPCEVFSHVLQTIRSFNITKDELVLGSVNAIYKRIIMTLNERNSKLKYYRLLSKILPSYLQSFNYKLHNNLLPVNTMFREYALDNDSCCLFCNVGPETTLHMFGSCEKLRTLWRVASETVITVTNICFNFSEMRGNWMLDLVCANLGNNYDFEKMLIYFNTIINYSIWRERNDIKFNFVRFGIGSVLKRIIKSMGARRNVDNKLLETRRIPYLRDLCSTFKSVSRKNFPFDNG